jgi:cytochrome P450
MISLTRNSFAGSDTTAISLRAIFYYLIHNRHAYDKLLNEIHTTELSDIVSYAEASKMPYLQACMKEAMRLHPAVGMLLERIVPAEGTTIEGVWLPGGTVIGINPWVVSRDPTVYGEDAEIYKPERWIESSPEQLKLMERNFLAVSLPTKLTLLQCLRDLVRCRCTDLSGEEYFPPRDVEACSTSAARI